MRSGSGRFYAIGTASGQPGSYLSSRIERSGCVLGVLVVKVDLRSIVTESRVESGPVLGVADEFGVVFLSSDPALLYRTLCWSAPSRWPACAAAASVRCCSRVRP